MTSLDAEPTTPADAVFEVDEQSAVLVPDTAAQATAMTTTPEFVSRWGMRMSPTRGGGGVRARGRRLHHPGKGGLRAVGAHSHDLSRAGSREVREESSRCSPGSQGAGKARSLDAEPGWTMPTWRTFAKSLFKSKVDDRSIASAKGREKWATILGHLARAKWGDYLLDRIEPRDLHEWRDSLPSLTWTRTRNDPKTGEEFVIKTGRYAASTLNDWLAIARVIFIAARKKYGLSADPMADLDDFPSREGRLLSRSALQKPFAEVTAACGIAKTITPRAMRRTFQDLMRAAGVDGVVAMAISNHRSDLMRARYSTASTPEVAAAIGKVVSIATARPRAGRGAKKAG